MVKNLISRVGVVVALALALSALTSVPDAHAQWFEDTYPGFFSLQTPGLLQATIFGGGFVSGTVFSGGTQNVSAATVTSMNVVSGSQNLIGGGEAIATTLGATGSQTVSAGRLTSSNVDTSAMSVSSICRPI